MSDGPLRRMPPPRDVARGPPERPPQQAPQAPQGHDDAGDIVQPPTARADPSQGELDLRRFDPSTMKPHRIAICIGKRGTGKSILIRDLLYHMRHKLDYGIAMSPTHDSADSFASFMPPSSVYREYRADIVEKMLLSQRDRSHERGMDALRSLYLVLDDCMYDKAVMKGRTIRDLFMNGRHSKIFFMCAVQWCMDLNPALRTQVDYCFCLRENLISNRERLWKYFFGVFPRYEDFSRVFDACTTNYECLVIDNTVQSNNIEDCIFWYKASNDVPPFRLCKPVYWELDARRSEERDGAGSRPGRPGAGSLTRGDSSGPCVITAPHGSGGKAPRVRKIVKHAGSQLPGV